MVFNQNTSFHLFTIDLYIQIPDMNRYSLRLIVSYRRLAPKFQHSLSAVTLGIYLGGSVTYLFYLCSEYAALLVVRLQDDRQLSLRVCEPARIF